MKRKETMLCAAWVLGTMLGACSQMTGFEEQFEKEEGQLSLVLGAGADFAATRSLSESTYRNVDNYTVVVTDKDGIEKMNCKGSEVASMMPLTLSIGSYSVRAFYGEEHPASRDEFYVLGEVSGSIKADQKESIEVVCEPTCGRIDVDFDEAMSTYFSDYNVTFTGTQALGSTSISWLKDDTEPWYVQLVEGGETITFTITTTTKDEYINGNQQQVATRTGSFKLGRNKGYKMNVNVNYTPTVIGGIEISITIDDGTNDIPVDIEVPIEWV